MCVYAALSRRAAGEFGFPLDDSWIHVRFAQNLARGKGFSFNPGHLASTTTGPLWTLVLALGYRLTHEFIFTAAALNWVFCSLAAITAGALGRTLIPRRAFGAAMAVVVALTVPLAWAGMSGMEPALSMWLTALGVLLHVRLRGARGIKSLAPTAAFGLAAWSRPELALLFPLAMLDRLLMGAKEARTASRDRYVLTWFGALGAHTVLFAALVAPMIAYNTHVIGRPLPSSYYIKAWSFGIGAALALGDSARIQNALIDAPLKDLGGALLMWAGNNAVLFIPFLFGLVHLIRGWGRRDDSAPRSLLIPLVLIVQPLAWGVSAGYQRTPWFQSQRYFSDLDILYLVVGMAGAWWLWDDWLAGHLPWQSTDTLERPTAGAAKRVAVAGIALILSASLARQPDQARMFALNVKNITDMQVTTARWLNAHVPKGSLLAANDIGAIAAITDMPVLDMIGLVSPEILSNLTVENYRSGAWNRLIWGVAAKEKVDYLVIVMRPERYAGFVRSGHKPIFGIRIEDNITCGGPIIAVFESKWHIAARGKPPAPPGGTP